MATTKTKKAESGKTVTVTQIAGTSGNGPKMKETLIGLGLGKIRATRVLQDTPEVRGMITRVRHLVKVDEKA